MDYFVYDSLLWLDIIAVFILMALFFGITVLLFYILKWCKVMNNQKNLKKSILMMGIFFSFMFLVMSTPAFLDICFDSYCVKQDIIKIERASKNASSRRININHTLICETRAGDVYECYDYLYGMENIEANPGNNCIVYGKHSKLLLDWIQK